MQSRFHTLLTCILVFTASLSTPANAINDTRYLTEQAHQFWFDINTLPTITLEFSEANWALLKTSTSDNREEVEADFTYRLNEQEYSLENIGVKLSGNTSFTLPEYETGNYTQANFTFDFDEFVDDQALSGIAAMKLKRFKDDSTFVHEPLSNQIMHNFNLWTAHSSAYTRLVITIGTRNEAYFGVYRMNESVNRHEYIDKRFGTDNDGGFLWQGNYKDWGMAHFSRITATWGGVGDFDNASFEYKSKGKYFEQAHAQLVEIATNFTQLDGDEFDLYITEHLNIEIFLKSLAAEAVLGHWDGFWGNGNNFMFYIDESMVLHFIPFDTDNTLGTSLFVDDVGERNPLNFAMEQNTPPLVRKMLSIQKYKNQYLGYIEQLVNDENLAKQEYANTWIENAHNLIKNELTNDTDDNENIIDQPAKWGNQPDYRLFDLNTGKRWFETRQVAVMTTVNASNHIYSQMYFRGTSNDWGSDAMQLIEGDVWFIQVTQSADNNSSAPRFKFDVNGDWQENFGDNNADGIVERAGADIAFKDGSGIYNIFFNAPLQTYQVFKLLPPVSNAGPDISIEVGSKVVFNGADSTDEDGQIFSYQWSNNLSGVSGEQFYNEIGLYVVTLTVTDNDGLTHSDEVNITVVTKRIGDDNNGADDRSGGAVFSLLFIIGFAFARRHLAN